MKLSGPLNYLIYQEEGTVSKAQALRLDESETDCIMVSVLRRKKKGEKNKDLTS